MTPWEKGLWGGVGEGSVGNFPPESLLWSVGLRILGRNGLPRLVPCALPLGVCLALHRDDSAAGLAAAECPQVTGCCIKLASVFCLPHPKMLGPPAAPLLLRQLHQPCNRRSARSPAQVVMRLVPASWIKSCACPFKIGFINGGGSWITLLQVPGGEGEIQP